MAKKQLGLIITTSDQVELTGAGYNYTINIHFNYCSLVRTYYLISNYDIPI